MIRGSDVTEGFSFTFFVTFLVQVVVVLVVVVRLESFVFTGVENRRIHFSSLIKRPVHQLDGVKQESRLTNNFERSERIRWTGLTS